MLGGIVAGALLFLSYVLQAVVMWHRQRRLKRLIEERDRLLMEIAEQDRRKEMSVEAVKAMLRGDRVIVTRPPDGESIEVAQAEVDGIGQQLRAAVRGDHTSKS